MKKKDGTTGWAKAVFTVEAAVIVPLSVTIIAFLIGYCFFVHQLCWLKGAAYESVVKSVERGAAKEERGTAAEKRMSRRVNEIPIHTGSIETNISAGKRISISWEGKILEEVFGNRFGYSGSAALTDFDPVSVKRLEYLVRYVKDKDE